MMVSLFITSKEYNTSYWEVMPTMYDFVNGCNHGYKFCLTFCSRMRLNLPGTVLPTLCSHSWAQENPHEVTQCHFQHRFSVNMWCGVLGNNLIGLHVIEGCLIAPYYRNFLVNELSLHLEDVPLAT
jgi:hypothetical protein